MKTRSIVSDARPIPSGGREKFGLRLRRPLPDGMESGADGVQPLKMLESELRALRQDLRRAVRAYVARLEIGLAQSAAVIASYRTNGQVEADRLREIRDLTIMVRNRRGHARSDGRKRLGGIDSLISELHLATHRRARP
jgi:hypothetical protein